MIEDLNLNFNDFHPSPVPIIHYRAVENKIDRVTMLPLSPTAPFVGAKVHFNSETGFFICKSDSKTTASSAECCEISGKAHWRIGTVLAVYITDDEGKIIRPTRFQICSWVFGENNYVKLRKIYRSLDLNIHCQSGRFQQLEFETASSFLWKEEYQSENKTVIDQAWEVSRNSLGKNMTMEEIKAKFPEGAATQSVPVFGGVKKESPAENRAPEIIPMSFVVPRRRKIFMG